MPNPVTNIGAAAYCEVDNKIIGIDCSKGRGVILPGGRWEYPETYHECAVREFQEETRLRCKDPKFLFYGVGPFGWLVYTFQVTLIDRFEWAHTNSGITGLVNWDQLFKSQFGQYYRVLKDVVNTRR